MEYYFVKYLSDTLTNKNGQIIRAYDLAVKYEYLSSMKTKRKKHKRQQQIKIVSTHKVLHPCLDVSVGNDIKDIPRSL